MVQDDDVYETAAAEQAVLTQDLETTRQARYEQSEAEGRMEDLGTLSGGEHQELWVGGTSLAKRLETGELTDASVAEYKAEVGRHFVPTTKGAAKRCVEDRTKEGYDHQDAAEYGRPLGPQVQGGTPDEAVVYRLGKGAPEDGVTILDDIKAVIETERSDYAPGAHTSGHGPTGCGSVDGEAPKLELYADDETAGVIEATTGTILELDNKTLDEGFMAKLREQAGALSADADKYFATLSQIPELVRDFNRNGVPNVVGSHKAIFVSLNFVRGTTFHPDDYNVATNDEAYCFNLDVWNIIDENDPETAAKLIAQAVGTLMILTDGSLHLLGRFARDEQAA